MADTAVVMPLADPAVPVRTRLPFVDNLRWVMILLVISMHAAVTYSHVGSWYYNEDPKPEIATTALFATYQAFLQSFFMGLLFLIAGYFVPDAFDRKGFGKFLRDRAIRLGIPTLLFMVLIQPFTVYWLLGHFADHSRPPLSRAFLPYLTSGRFLSVSGPMWFTLALLIFSAVYGIVRVLSPKRVASSSVDVLPSDRHVVGLALLIGLCTFLVRIVQPIGTNFFNMQFCFFSQYIVLFIIGIYAWRQNWLLRIPYEFGMRWFKLMLLLGALVWIGLIVAVVKTHTEALVSGGFTWQSAVLCLWESFVCLGTCLGLLVMFRERFNSRTRATQWLSDNCFAVYLFHTPLLIAVTLVLRSLPAPKPIKFLCATVLGAIVTYLASNFVFRRIPVLKRVL